MIQNKKGSLFFTLDAIISLLLITSIFVVLGSTDVLKYPVGQVKNQIIDYTEFFYETTVLEANSEFNYSYSAPDFNAFVDARRGKTNMFEEVSYLYHNDIGNRGSDTVRNLTPIVLSSSYNLEYKIDNTTIYEYKRKEKEDADVHLTQSIVTITENKTSGDLIGPNTTKVSIWI